MFFPLQTVFFNDEERDAGGTARVALARLTPIKNYFRLLTGIMLQNGPCLLQVAAAKKIYMYQQRVQVP